MMDGMTTSRTVRSKPRSVSRMGARLRSSVPPWILLAMSSIRTCVVGETWMAAGDSAKSFDPLSSQGILGAMQSGVWSARTLNAQFSGTGEEAAVEYEAMNRRAFASYLTLHKAFYQMETRWPNSTFWSRRRTKVLRPIRSEFPMESSSTSDLV